MSKSLTIAICTLILLSVGHRACAESFSECRTRCESEFTACSNDSPAADFEVQAAKMAACDQSLQSCYAQCENFKPAEEPTGTENNPNLIVK